MKEGWTYKKLGEVCVKITDGSHNPPKGVERSNNIMLSSQNVQNGYLNMSSVRYLSDDDFKIEDQRTKASKGDVLLTIVGTIGRTCVLNGNEGNITFQRSVAILKPSKDVTSYYLMYYLLSQSNTLNTKAQGAAQKGIYLKQLGDFEILYPTLSEQQRIVSRLDSAFAHIDERKANAEKQLSEARALFQKALTKAMEPKEGWEEKKMKEIVVSLTDGDHQPPPKSNDGIPFITISNIDKDSNRIDFENTFFVPRSYFEGLKKDRIPHEGDVLYTVTGSFGIPVLIDFQKEFCFQRHIALIRPNQNRLSSKFLYYWILSSYATTQADDTATGTAQRTVSLNSLRNFVITIPPLSEQQRIVSRLDSLSAHVRELEEVLQKTIAECDALKQALLRQVFE